MERGFRGPQAPPGEPLSGGNGNCQWYQGAPGSIPGLPAERTAPRGADAVAGGDMPGTCDTAKLARVLLEQFRQPVADGPVRLSGSHMAALAGINLQEVAHCLRVMDGGGLIRINRHRIVVTDRAALETLAGDGADHEQRGTALAACPPAVISAAEGDRHAEDSGQNQAAA